MEGAAFISFYIVLHCDNSCVIFSWDFRPLSWLDKMLLLDISVIFAITLVGLRLGLEKNVKKYRIAASF